MTDVAVTQFPLRPRWTPGAADLVCGRPLRSPGRRNRTCNVGRAHLYGPEQDVYQLPACRTHLTADERESVSAFTAALEAAATERRRKAVPACWLWEFSGLGGLENPDADRRLSEMYPNRPARERAEFRALRLILAWQSGRCAICEASGLSGLRMVEDHDHWTTFVRGYLCHACNTLEGKSTHPVFAKYRQRNPASILGVTSRYWDPWTMEFARPDPGL